MELPYSKLRYYLLFIYYKLRIVYDCKSERVWLYFAEILHIFNVIFRTSYEMPHHDTIRKIVTCFGTFHFLADNNSYSVVSPAFERPDIEVFIRNIKDAVKAKKKVLFLDIGANHGLYSVAVFRATRNKNVKIIAVEPDPVYHHLLVKNIQSNNVKNIDVLNIALSDHMGRARVPGLRLDGKKVSHATVEFILKKLDNVIPQKECQRVDEIFVKMDIEGNEISALEGASKLLSSGKTVRLMVEDCVNPDIVPYLKSHGFQFIQKLTPYDSFWQLS